MDVNLAIFILLVVQSPEACTFQPDAGGYERFTDRVAGVADEVPDLTGDFSDRFADWLPGQCATGCRVAWRSGSPDQGVPTCGRDEGPACHVIGRWTPMISIGFALPRASFSPT